MAHPRHRRTRRPAWWRGLVISAAAIVLSGPLVADDTVPEPGCHTIFRAGTTLTLSGKTVQGVKNAFSVAITLELTAETATALGVPIVAGTVRSERLKGGAVSWRSRPGSRWGNLCMDTVAPDGRRWSLLALSWEDDNAHPNLHGAIDWSAGNNAGVVGFVDTKDGAYHEAQVILKYGTPATARTAPVQSEDVPETARGSLCDALFGGHTSHFFVGKGYATRAGTSAGHLAIYLSPGTREGKAIPLAGGYIATGGPHALERHSVTAENSACIDMPDSRYALLQLGDGCDGALVLWLWGEGGVPQKDDRLMGHVTFPDSAIVHSKVALWRL